MSVSDPLIKDLKGCAVQFLQVTQPVTDEFGAVSAFCETLEHILQRGLLVRINAFGSWKEPEAWHWLVRMAQSKYRAPYFYQMSVEKAMTSEKVKSEQGRARLLVRYCLNNRCLHVPFQLLLETQHYKEVYGQDSVLGSEILSQILMSVVMLPARLQFKLDCDNARFLDESWQLPATVRLTLVPAEQLGISLTFVDGKAITVEVLPDSVASEDDQVEVGDVLDELNSVVVTAAMQGSLSQVLKKSAGRPITVYLVKARHKGQLYSPLIPLLRRAGLSPSQILNSSSDDSNVDKPASMMYIGQVLTDDRGDVKEIRRAVNQLLGQPYDAVTVNVDCHEMGVTVTRVPELSVLLKHSYMQISSCGCTVQVPNYFAYIAEDRSVVPENRFVCYVFHSDSQELIDTTLMSIGQGFKRTHFAV